MATKTLIGVDIGTQGTKAVLFSTAGETLATSFEPSQLHQPAPGVVEENPENQFDSVCHTIASCVRQAQIDPAAVAGIAIDGQMAGIIGIGRDGKHVTPYDSWLDTRCAPYIRRMDIDAGDAVLVKTGSPPSFNHGPKILWWMHEHPETFAQIASFVQPGGYAAMRLCELDAGAAYIDATYLHFSGFADNRRAVWDTDLCRQFALDPAKLPNIVEPQAVIGEVGRQAAARCGIAPGIPVVAGCGDTAASFLSCGATAEGICVDVAGTASVFATTTTSFRPDVQKILGCGRSATPGLWHPYAYINGGGMNLEWFRREFAGQSETADREALGFDALNKVAEQVMPGDDDPLFIPHLGGRVCPSQPHLRGAWAGLTWNHTLGHLYRAVLEGVALEYGVYQRALLSLYAGFSLSELRITGGGEKSALWNQLKADVLGTRVVQIARTEGAPLGSALLAGYGVGLFSDLPATAAQWITTGRIVEPDREMADHYRKRLDRYIRLLEKLDGV